ncbi:cobalamin biosynthesis protein [Brucella sp. 2280]|uniref:cobalamin biosynthesis protein n=1 Tax=Brucella sp. 2280 TaxID=2592625 RepID=UPI001297CD03|nr:cobalamin biosynthesis protein [Brucella sp. 2280]QGA56105.1 antifreeze protein [Brucella sp. 2280]
MADPKFYLGMGCSSAVTYDELLTLAEEALTKGGCSRPDGIATLSTKRGDPAWVQLAAHYGCELRFFEASRLEDETPRLNSPSQETFKAVGCHGVAEAAALAFAGPNGHLVVGKITSARSTAALAMVPTIPL